MLADKKVRIKRAITSVCSQRRAHRLNVNNPETLISNG